MSKFEMIRINVSRAFAFASVSMLAAAALAGAKPNMRLSIVADHADCHYRGGESASLTVTVTDTNGVRLTSGEVKVATDSYCAQKLAETKVFDLSKANPFTTAVATRKTPGFIRWHFTATNGFSQVFGVGYDTAAIVPGTPEPTDFDAFWSEAIARYDREIPDPPQVKLDSSLCDKSWDVWRITLNAPCGRKVHGFITKPKEAAGRLPARIGIAAAGYGGWSQAPSKNKGMISLSMTVYPFEPDPKLGKKAEYDALFATAREKWGANSYSTGGISESREAYFFYPVILANRRAIEYFARRPDVDAAHITYSGTSQGGGLGIVAMAMCPCITRGVVFVPALTDLLSYNVEGRRSGWPQIVEAQRNENKAATRKNAPYFCCVNFARRVKTPIRFVVGFSDMTCPPHAVYSAFNVCPSSDKSIIDGIGMPHQVTSGPYRQGMDWLER